MRKCAQCGNNIPSNIKTCTVCGYTEQNGFSFNKNGLEGNNKFAKIIVIVVMVMAVMIIGVTFIVMSNIKSVNNSILDKMDNGFSTTLEECSNNCDGSYMYMNGMCTCTNMDLE